MTSDALKLRDSYVLVIGDLVLDSYLRGSVSRISPEAPVPVLLETGREDVLGGAANVAANIAAFGGRSEICGRVGADPEARILLELCEARGIATRSVIHAPEALTTRKTRVVAGYQQLCRVDREVADPLKARDENLVLQALERFLLEDSANGKCVVLSDYGKGMLSRSLCHQIIGLCRASKVPVVVDPKSPDPRKYEGATVLKPNRAEARRLFQASHPEARFATRAEEHAALANFAREAGGVRNVALSVSEDGIVVSGADVPETLRFPSHALQVADVSGAGDTVIAFLAMGLAASLPLARATEMANVAAGIVCAKLGTATVSAAEFQEAEHLAAPAAAGSKVVSAADAALLCAQLRRGGKRVVFTNGCFDLLHAGHVQYLSQARSLGDTLIVGMNDDASVRRLKGPARPLQAEEDRELVLASLACVDLVVRFSEDTPLELICRIRPDVLVKGADYTLAGTVGASEVQAWGGEVHLLPLLKGRSTTDLVNRAREGGN